MTIRRTTLISGVVTIAILLLLAACNSKPAAEAQSSLSSQQPSSQDSGTRNGVIFGPPIESQQQQNSLSNGQQPINIVQPLQQRIVLKDANLQIVVADVTATLDTIAKMADAMGGWVINSNTSKISRASGDDAVTGSIAIRVPATQLDAALTQIKGQATSVDSETVTGQDVTQEYTDLNSQLTNLKAAEKQLQTILDSATTTDDVLKIYTELVRVRGEIETAQGRINYYKQASDFSSITVTLRPPTVPQASVQVDAGWSPGTTVSGAFNMLVNVLQGFANLLIMIVVFVIPLILVITIPLWVIYKLLRRFGWFTPRTPASKISNSPANTQVENDVG